jgi:hypothetical protein
MRAIPDSGSFVTISNRPLKRPQKLRPEIVDNFKHASKMSTKLWTFLKHFQKVHKKVDFFQSTPKSPQKFREENVDKIESSYICPQQKEEEKWASAFDTTEAGSKLFPGPASIHYDNQTNVQPTHLR